MQRPENHVTRALRERQAAALGEQTTTLFPDLTARQVEWLKAYMAPKCYDPRVENLEAHLMFAGKVAFAQQLITQWDEKREEDSSPADPEAEQGERASSQPT